MKKFEQWFVRMLKEALEKKELEEITLENKDLQLVKIIKSIYVILHKIMTMIALLGLGLLMILILAIIK